MPGTIKKYWNSITGLAVLIVNYFASIFPFPKIAVVETPGGYDKLFVTILLLLVTIFGAVFGKRKHFLVWLVLFAVAFVPAILFNIKYQDAIDQTICKVSYKPDSVYVTGGKHYLPEFLKTYKASYGNKIPGHCDVRGLGYPMDAIWDPKLIADNTKEIFRGHILTQSLWALVVILGLQCLYTINKAKKDSQN